jgi:hypothetical protein
MRAFLVNLKNKTPLLLYIWSLHQKRKGIKNLKKYSDKEAVLNLYKNYSGTLPNLDQPITFSEKLQWMKLNYHNPLMQITADKWEVRAYLKKKGYGALLSTVISVHDTIKDFDVQKLPKNFVVKATHGSGWNLICTDKEKINWFWWKKIMHIWLNNNIFWPGREWPYKYMKPRLIVEEVLVDNSGCLMDYKFFCFNGKVKFVQANKGRDTKEHAQNFYDLEWKILPFGKDLKPRADIIIDAPINLYKMSEIAQDLSKEFPFVRIDFYEVNKKVIFGEMTFYPKSGLPDFNPIEYDLILGEYIHLPEKMISK